MEQSEIDRFYSNVNKTDTCWLWTDVCHKGYGKFTYNKKTHLSHRISWVLSGRILIEGYVLYHTCQNKHCVNPAHSTQDVITAVRNEGIKNGLAKLTDENVLAIRASKHSQVSIANHYNVTQALISKVINKKAWKHI